MFISIPREFFVPVVFGEGFTLNEENNNLVQVKKVMPI